MKGKFRVPAVELGKFALVMSFAKDLRRLWVKVKVRVGLVMSVLPYIYDADGLGLVFTTAVVLVGPCQRIGLKQAEGLDLDCG